VGLTKGKNRCEYNNNNTTVPLLLRVVVEVINWPSIVLVDPYREKKHLCRRRDNSLHSHLRLALELCSFCISSRIIAAVAVGLWFVDNATRFYCSYMI
jgi:hypothetical protein